MLAFIVRLKTRAILRRPVVLGLVVRGPVVRGLVVRGLVVRGLVVLGAVAVLFVGIAAAAGITPHPARVTSAAQTCISYAAAAGWANNGRLVTASAGRV